MPNINQNATPSEDCAVTVSIKVIAKWKTRARSRISGLFRAFYPSYSPHPPRPRKSKFLSVLPFLIAPFFVSGCATPYYFCLAAERGDIDAVRSYLDHGFDVKTKNKALMCTKSVIVAQLLIDKGANELSPALKNAVVRRKSLDIVRLLIDKGADVNATDTKSNSVLTYAFMHCSPPYTVAIEMARFLMKRGAKIPAGYAILMYDSCSLKVDVDKYTWHTNTGVVYISAGSHNLTLTYHGYNQFGEPITLPIAVKAGGIYGIFYEIKEGIWGSKWRAWIEDNAGDVRKQLTTMK